MSSLCRIAVPFGRPCWCATSLRALRRASKAERSATTLSNSSSNANQYEWPPDRGWSHTAHFIRTSRIEVIHELVLLAFSTKRRARLTPLQSRLKRFMQFAAGIISCFALLPRTISSAEEGQMTPRPVLIERLRLWDRAHMHSRSKPRSFSLRWSNAVTARINSCLDCLDLGIGSGLHRTELYHPNDLTHLPPCGAFSFDPMTNPGRT